MWSHKVGRAEPMVKRDDVLRYVNCLAGFGLGRESIANAVGVSVNTLRCRRDAMHLQSARKIEALHWGLHYRHAPFRQHCQCARNLVALQSFEEVAS